MFVLWQTIVVKQYIIILSYIACLLFTFIAGGKEIIINLCLQAVVLLLILHYKNNQLKFFLLLQFFLYLLGNVAYDFNIQHLPVNYTSSLHIDIAFRIMTFTSYYNEILILSLVLLALFNSSIKISHIYLILTVSIFFFLISEYRLLTRTTISHLFNFTGIVIYIFYIYDSKKINHSYIKYKQHLLLFIFLLKSVSETLYTFHFLHNYRDTLSYITPYLLVLVYFVVKSKQKNLDILVYGYFYTGLIILVSILLYFIDPKFIIIYIVNILFVISIRFWISKKYYKIETLN